MRMVQPTGRGSTSRYATAVTTVGGSKGSRLPDNRWYGPFGTVQQAVDQALRTGRQDAGGSGIVSGVREVSGSGLLLSLRECLAHGVSKVETRWWCLSLCQPLWRLVGKITLLQKMKTPAGFRVPKPRGVDMLLNRRVCESDDSMWDLSASAPVSSGLT